MFVKKEKRKEKIMSNNSHYWVNRKERAKRAEKHTKEMESTYYAEIGEAIKSAKVFDSNSSFGVKEEAKAPEIIFLNTDTVSAIFSKGYSRIAVLNFASYKNPGGMFLKGSKAQEECLCHESFLFNVLRKCPEYYEWNNAHKNRALYTDRALYTKGIRFFHDDESVLCDVITCAAPNWSAASKMASPEENSKALKERIEFVKKIAENRRVDVIILGAWGAGVFGQDPEEVASYMKEVFAETTIKRVVYAVPGNDENAKIFRKKFEN